MGTESGLRRRVQGLSEAEFRQRFGTEPGAALPTDCWGADISCRRTTAPPNRHSRRARLQASPTSPLFEDPMMTKSPGPNALTKLEVLAGAIHAFAAKLLAPVRRPQPTRICPTLADTPDAPVLEDATPRTHPIRHGRGQSAGPEARAAAQVRPVGAQGTRSRRPETQLPPDRSRVGAEQEHGSRHRQAPPRHDSDRGGAASAIYGLSATLHVMTGMSGLPRIGGMKGIPNFPKRIPCLSAAE